MICEICNKPIKENTDGNNRYCQGHDVFERQNAPTTTKREAKKLDNLLEKHYF